MKRVVVTTLSLLSLWGGMVVPILDSGDLQHRPVVESAHDPTACVRGHDHSICTQVAASRAAPVERTRDERGPAPALHAAGPAALPALVPQSHRLSPLGSRGPPSA